MENKTNKYHPDLILGLIARNKCPVAGCAMRTSAQIHIVKNQIIIKKTKLLCSCCMNMTEAEAINEMFIKKLAKAKGLQTK